MQQGGVAPEPDGAGFPEFSELGRTLELLRIHRGISKQHLARYAGISRQQLWRVMTGKSELTASLRERLAQALAVRPGELVADADASGARVKTRLAGRPTSMTTAAGPITGVLVARGSASSAAPAPVAGEPSLAEYVADPVQLRRTMASLPSGADGLRLKRQLLNALEDLAIERSLTLPASFFETRREVLAGEV